MISVLMVNPQTLAPFLQTYRNRDDLGQHHMGKLIASKVDFAAVEKASAGNKPVLDLLSTIDIKKLED